MSVQAAVASPVKVNKSPLAQPSMLTMYGVHGRADGRRNKPAGRIRFASPNSHGSARWLARKGGAMTTKKPRRTAESSRHEPTPGIDLDPVDPSASEYGVEGFIEAAGDAPSVPPDADQAARRIGAARALIARYPFPSLDAPTSLRMLAHSMADLMRRAGAFADDAAQTDRMGVREFRDELHGIIAGKFAIAALDALYNTDPDRAEWFHVLLDRQLHRVRDFVMGRAGLMPASVAYRLLHRLPQIADRLAGRGPNHAHPTSGHGDVAVPGTSLIELHRKSKKAGWRVSTQSLRRLRADADLRARRRGEGFTISELHLMREKAEAGGRYQRGGIIALIDGILREQERAAATA